jgi:hypothetical protein
MTGDLTSFIVTYTIPSGISGVPGTVVQDIVDVSDPENVKVNNQDVPTDIAKVVRGTTVEYTIHGLVAGTTYKVSIVGQDTATGAVTKAVAVTQKTQKLPTKAPLKFAAVGKPTITSVKLQWNDITTLPADAYYVIEVWSPKTKTAAPKLVQTINVEADDKATVGTTVNGLLANTKYTFAVKAVDIDGNDLTPFAVKAITTAKWVAPSGLKFNANTVTGSIPKDGVWTKDNVHNDLDRADAYSQFALYYLTTSKVEVFLGFVDASIDADANKVTLDDISELLSNVDKSKVGSTITFLTKAVVLPDIGGFDELDIINCSLVGKFTVKQGDL